MSLDQSVHHSPLSAEISFRYLHNLIPIWKQCVLALTVRGFGVFAVIGIFMSSVSRCTLAFPIEDRFHTLLFNTCTTSSNQGESDSFKFKG